MMFARICGGGRKEASNAREYGRAAACRLSLWLPGQAQCSLSRIRIRTGSGKFAREGLPEVSMRLSGYCGFVSAVEDFEYEKLGLPRPDRVLYLDVPPEISQALMLKRYVGDASKKDIHERDFDFLRHCRTCALYAAEKLNWIVINCAANGSLRTEEDIQNEILSKLEDLL